MILRRAMGGLLPEKVQWRAGKTDFLPNLIRGIVRFGGDYIGDLIKDSPSNVVNQIAGYVNPTVVGTAFAKLRRGEEYESEREVFTIMSVILLALWSSTSGEISTRYVSKDGADRTDVNRNPANTASTESSGSDLSNYQEAFHEQANHQASVSRS
jgi:hypothetical protein